VELVPKQPSARGPADWFTGEVWIDPVAQGQKPSQWALNAGHFTPGARNASCSRYICDCHTIPVPV
jgi:hypothetical protein